MFSYCIATLTRSSRALVESLLEVAATVSAAVATTDASVARSHTVWTVHSVQTALINIFLLILISIACDFGGRSGRLSIGLRYFSLIGGRGGAGDTEERRGSNDNLVED